MSTVNSPAFNHPRSTIRVQTTLRSIVSRSNIRGQKSPFNNHAFYRHSAGIDIGSTGCVSAECLVGYQLFTVELTDDVKLENISLLESIYSVIGQPSASELAILNPTNNPTYIPQRRKHLRSLAQLFRNDQETLELLRMILRYKLADALPRRNCVIILISPSFHQYQMNRATWVVTKWGKVYDLFIRMYWTVLMCIYVSLTWAIPKYHSFFELEFIFIKLN